MNSTLTDLSLDCSGICAGGAVALCEALRVNSTLTTLSLNFNDIGDDGAVALGEMLRVNDTLAFIDIAENLGRSQRLTR